MKYTYREIELEVCRWVLPNDVQSISETICPDAEITTSMKIGDHVFKVLNRSEYRAKSYSESKFDVLPFLMIKIIPLLDDSVWEDRFSADTYLAKVLQSEEERACLQRVFEEEMDPAEQRLIRESTLGLSPSPQRPEHINARDAFWEKMAPAIRAL